MTTSKIFIKNYEPLLLIKKLTKLDEYFRNKKNTIDIISTNGLFSIENGKIYKLNPIDVSVVSVDFEGYELLLDKSTFERENVISQIPYNNISFNITTFYYCQEHLNKKSFLKLIIEGIYENKNDIATMEKNDSDKYFNFTPTNFYFLTDESFDNILVKKELNVFLSMLK
jgi:hypothetical protein